MARKPLQETPAAGAPAWMATYGDLVTLLLCFFVLLFASSTTDAAKMEAIANSFSYDPKVIMQSGSGSDMTEMVGNGIMEVPERPPQTSEEQQKQKEESQKELNAMASDFETYFAENNVDEQINVEVGDGYVLLTFEDSILFDTGKADIKPEAIDPLNLVIDELNKYPEYNVEIVGYTDTDPINTVQFPNNWYLSSARAINVGTYLIDEGGIDPARISAVGKGEYFPVAPNDTPENKAKNRRVEIYIRTEK